MQAKHTHTTPRQRKHEAALLRGDTSATPLIWSTVSQLFALHATAGRWCCTLIVRSPSIGDSCSAVTILGAELHETNSQLGCRRLIKVARPPSSMSTVLCFTGIHWHNLKVHFQITNSKQQFFISIDMSVKVLNSSRRH